MNQLRDLWLESKWYSCLYNHHVFESNSDGVCQV